MRASFTCVVLFAVGLSFPALSAAQTTDGLYGRFNGDVMLAPVAGAGLDLDSGQPIGFLGLRALYLDSVGVLLEASYRAPGSTRFVVGLQMRPLFPALFLINQSSGNEFLDLLVGSITFEMGVAVTPLADPGAALVLGAGFEVPVVLPSWFGHGVFLRPAIRYVASGFADEGGPNPPIGDVTVSLSLVIPISLDLGISGRDIDIFRRR